MKNSTALIITDDEIPFNRPTAHVADNLIAGTDMPWYEHPDRRCKDRPEFADLALIPRRGRKAKVQSMVSLCMACPVLRECRADYLATTPDYAQFGVRAGIVGKV